MIVQVSNFIFNYISFAFNYIYIYLYLFINFLFYKKKCIIMSL